MLPLSVSWVQARQQQQAAIEERHFAQREREVRMKTNRNAQLLMALAKSAPFVVIAIVVAYSFDKFISTRNEEAKALEAREQRVRELGEKRKAEVSPLVSALNQSACSDSLQPLQVIVGAYQATLPVSEAGACFHVLASSDSPAQLKVMAPSGKVTEKTGEGPLDLNYCAEVRGEHKINLVVSDDVVSALAMMECPSAFEKNKLDPKKNGLAAAQARLAVLQKEGCARVIFAAESVSGERPLTLRTQPGNFCPVLVAAAGSQQNLLTASMKTPTAETVAMPPAASEIEVAYCAQVAGEYKLSIVPANLDYFTLAAMDCPKQVAKRHGAK